MIAPVRHPRFISSIYPALSPQTTGSKPIVGGLCDLEASSSSAENLQYTLMRVGPFTSNGGYDWWQYAGHDALKLSRHLSGGRTIGINSHWVTAVEVSTGRPLGYPPMHVHHSKPYRDGTARAALSLNVLCSRCSAARAVPLPLLTASGSIP